MNKLTFVKHHITKLTNFICFLVSACTSLHSRGDVVQVDTWVAASGKNGMRRDWILRDYNTGEVLTRASRLE